MMGIVVAEWGSLSDDGGGRRQGGGVGKMVRSEMGGSKVEGRVEGRWAEAKI